MNLFIVNSEKERGGALAKCYARAIQAGAAKAAEAVGLIQIHPENHTDRALNLHGDEIANLTQNAIKGDASWQVLRPP